MIYMWIDSFFDIHWNIKYIYFVLPHLFIPSTVCFMHCIVHVQLFEGYSFQSLQI